MGFARLSLRKDLESGKMKGVKVGDKDILIADLDGNYYAIGNRCTHAGCKLSEGTLGGENVRCPCHMSVFNVKTGNIVDGPAREPATIFQVKIEGDQILVNV
jgi:nitrite reductase/ring-hydroxylating ferredoxin subunit